MNQGFDLIGDIHGHADALEALLRRLGYDDADGCYRHDERKALFLGDYIDGGQSNRRVYQIVRTMVEQGEAFAIMGNHEYNAICYHTPAPRSTGGWLREHSAQKRGQHQTTLSEFDDDPAGLVEMVDWFKTLPLYIELDGLRAVHACWDASALRHVDRTLGPSARFTDDFLMASARECTIPSVNWPEPQRRQATRYPFVGFVSANDERRSEWPANDRITKPWLRPN